MGFGLIGAGKWGKHYIRICREEKLGLKTIATKTNKKMKQILKDQKINKVIIATPPKTHYKIIKQCLNSGKNVLCEKPLVLNVKQAVELKKLSKGLVLSVGYQYLHNAYIKKLKKFVQKGEGNYRHFSWLLRINVSEINKETINDAVCHFVSILLFFFDFKKIVIEYYGKPTEKSGLVILRVKIDNKDSGVLMLGTKEKSKINIINILTKKGNVTLKQNGLKVNYFINGLQKNFVYEEPLKVQVREFVNCVKNKRVPINDIDNSIIISKILKSFDKKI